MPCSALAIKAEIKDGKTVVTVTREDCETLVPDAAYHPDPGEDIAYKPGVDADGAPVVPADTVSQPTFTFPETISIPLQLNITQRFGIDYGLGTKMEPTLGSIEIHADGRISYNGEPLAEDLQQKIKTICRSKYNM